MKFIKKFAFLTALFAILTSCGIGVVDPNNSENNYIRDIELRVNGVDNVIAGLYQYAENGLYYILTQTRLGVSLNNAYFILEDGSKQLISDIKEFAITNNITAIEVNFVPGVALEGFTLNANSYSGYYLGNPYYLNLISTSIPSDATNNKIKYFSSNPFIASIDNFGKITVRGIGNVAINAVSLEGNYKQTLQMSIRDGKATLKDSVVNNDLLESTISGNRYDENSGQSSVFQGVTFTESKNDIITVGSAKYSNNQNIALVNKFGLKGETTNSSLNIDSSNVYFSEELFDITYDSSSNRYFSVGNVMREQTSKNSGLLVSFSENKQFSPSRLELKNTIIYSYNSPDIVGSDAFFTGVITTDEYVFVSGFLRWYVPDWLPTPFNEWRATFIKVYDKELNSVGEIWFNNSIQNAWELTSLVYNQFNGALIVSGRTQTATFIAELLETTNLNFQLRVGYYSNIQDALITDVAPISAIEYVVIGNGKINQKEISFITTFSKVGNEFQSFNSIKNEFYNSSFANKVFAVNGIITVLGYARENQLFDYRQYATLTNYDYSLSYIGGKVYFNGNAEIFSNKGHKQRFNDAVITDFNIVVGVGASNYNFANQDNGYIQYNIPLV